MKKLLAIVLASLMMFAFVANIAAEEQEGCTDDFTDDVDVNVTLDVNQTGNYVFDVSWGSFDFTYETTSVWDAENYDYDEVGGAWKDGRNSSTITVTNRSAIELNVVVNYENVVGNEVAEIFEVTFSDIDTTLDPASPSGDPDSVSGTLTVTKNVEYEVAKGDATSGAVKIGTVSISISDVQP